MANRWQKMSVEERFFEKVDKTQNCWLWLASVGGSGYGQFFNGDTLENSHRYSYRLHNGKIPEGYVVMHSCDTPLCVNPAHLIAGTQKQNIHDMLLKSRQRTAETYIKQSGEKAWNSVLTNKQAIAIRQEYARGHTSWLKLARKYGVAKKTIGNIIQGVTYVNC